MPRKKKLTQEEQEELQKELFWERIKKDMEDVDRELGFIEQQNEYDNSYEKLPFHEKHEEYLSQLTIDKMNNPDFDRKDKIPFYIREEKRLAELKLKVKKSKLNRLKTTNDELKITSFDNEELN